MPDLTAGTKVLYSAHDCHQLDTGFVPGRGGLRQLFRFVHHKPHAAGGKRAGDPAEPHEVGALAQRNADGSFDTEGGRTIRHAGPHHYWPATVVRVNADGTCDLEVEHPRGGVTLHYPDRGAHPGAAGVPHDPKKGAHTFHLPGE